MSEKRTRPDNSKNLTSTTVKKLRVTHTGKTIADSEQPGLYIYLGSRQQTWRLCVRRRRVDYDIKLGSFAELDTEKARVAARAKLAEIEGGRGGVDITQFSIADGWEATKRADLAPATLVFYRKLWRLEVKQKWAGSGAVDLAMDGRREIIRWHKEVSTRRSPHMANAGVKVLASCIGHLKCDYPRVPRLNLSKFPWHPEPPRKFDLSDQRMAEHHRTVLKHANPVRRAMFETCYLTGLRPKSLIDLKPEHIDGDWLRNVPTKIGPWDFPITDPVKAVLERTRNWSSHWIFPSTVNMDRQMTKYAMSEEGALPMSALRKHFSTAGNKTLPAPVAETLVGHKLTGKMRDQYWNPTEAELMDAAQILATGLAKRRDSLLR